MKTYATILFTAALFTLLPVTSAFAQGSSAVEHMTIVLSSINDLKGETWQYLKSVTKGKSARTVEKKREELVAAIKSKQIAAKRFKGYNGDTRLTSAVQTYLELCYAVLKEDFDKIVDMEDIAEQSYDYMEAYLIAKEQANEKLNEAFEAMVNAQKAFAAEHNIELRDADNDKTVEKINKANDVLKYYNDIYLVFFKSYKQEIYLLDALQRQDVSGIEQNTGALAGMAAEGLEKLKSMQAYRGDNSLRNAAMETMKFYQEAAGKDYPTMVDLFIKKDNFEKVQKMVDSKPKKDRTQEDVDQFNAASNEYNQAVAAYNKTNESLNSRRTKYLKGWNESSDKFFETHTN